MITIGIDPVAFHIGDLAVSWYIFMIAVAAAVFLSVAIIEFRRIHLSWKHLTIMAVWALAGALSFCNFVYIVGNWDAVLENPLRAVGHFTWNLPWIIAGGIIALLLMTKINKLSFWKVIDVIAIAVFPAFAVQRIGCIIAGCCHGLPAVLPWSVAYTNVDSLAPLGVPIHPTQLYYLLWNIAAYIVLKVFRPHTAVDGAIFMLALALYGTGDLIIRFYRDEATVFFGLQMGQIIGILLLFISIPWFILKMRETRKESITRQKA